MSEYIRRNVLGLVAIFLALGGTAAALPGKNKVDSGDIRAGNVKLSDLGASSVDGSKVVDNALKGADVDESSLEIPQQSLPETLPPSGPAAGDLAGEYPNPQVSEAGLAAGGDLSGTLAGAQVAESGLATGGDLSGALSNAQIGGDAVGAVETGDQGDEIADGSVDSQDSSDVVRQISISPAQIADPVPSTGQAPVHGVGPFISPHLSFAPGSESSMVISTEMPADRVAGTPVSLDLEWSAPVAGTVGNNSVVWDARFNSIGPAVSFGNIPTELNSVTTSANTAGPRRTSTISGITTAAGNVLNIEIVRDGDSVADDYTNPARLHMITLEYTAAR